MSTYTVNHAYADKTVGDVVDGADISPVDLAYLLNVGAISPANATPPAAKRAKKESTKSED